MTTVSSAMQNLSRQALKGLAVTLSLIIYLAGLVYAGVRSYSLFAATIAPDLLPLSVLGIVALELTAVGLPLAIHYWTAPGAQRLAAMGFYVLDLGLIVGNSVLDAAHQSGTLLPGFMQGYGTYAVPALPVVCMVGWAVLWALDPSSREHDMVASVRAATHEALMSQIAKAAEAVDITEAVELAAGEAARALVGETLGRAPRQSALPAYRYPPALAAGGSAEPWAGDQFVSAEEAQQKGWDQLTAREISDYRAQGADTRTEQGQSHGIPEPVEADQLAIPTGKVARKPARNGTRPEAADPKHPPRADGASRSPREA